MMTEAHWGQRVGRRRDHRWSECPRVDGGAVGGRGLWRSFRKRPVGTVQPPLESGVDATSTRKHCQCLTVETGAQRVGRRWGCCAESSLGRWGVQTQSPGHCPQCCAESSLRRWGCRRRALGHCPQCCAESSLRRPGCGAGPAAQVRLWSLVEESQGTPRGADGIRGP